MLPASPRENRGFPADSFRLVAFGELFPVATRARAILDLPPKRVEAQKLLAECRAHSESPIRRRAKAAFRIGACRYIRRWFLAGRPEN